MTVLLYGYVIVQTPLERFKQKRGDVHLEWSKLASTSYALTFTVFKRESLFTKQPCFYSSPFERLVCLCVCACMFRTDARVDQARQQSHVDKEAACNIMNVLYTHKGHQ